MERYVRRSARIHAHATARLHTALVAAGARCPQPAGAFYLYPDFAPWREQLASRHITTSAELANHLLEQWDIATLPASDFGEAPDALRLRLATSLLYTPADVSPAEQEAILNGLLEQADDLPADSSQRSRMRLMRASWHLPALDEAAARLTEFASSLR